MVEWLLGGNAWWFSVPALLGTAYFVLNLVIGEMGADADLDVDAADSPTSEFRVLSLQSISAFAMGSGWMGLGALRLLEWSTGAAVVVAVAGGVGVAWLVIWLLGKMMRLQSSGNVRLGSTLGERGTVYVAVPPSGDGSGRVTLVVGGKQREFNATQDGDMMIPSRARVKVIGVDEAGNTVKVEVVDD